MDLWLQVRNGSTLIYTILTNWPERFYPWQKFGVSQSFYTNYNWTHAQENIFYLDAAGCVNEFFKFIKMLQKRYGQDYVRRKWAFPIPQYKLNMQLIKFYISSSLQNIFGAQTKMAIICLHRIMWRGAVPTLSKPATLTFDLME